jgi:hypothetical protein
MRIATHGISATLKVSVLGVSESQQTNCSISAEIYALYIHII